MISLVELNTYLVDLLEPQRFKDYCPNGLQIEGRSSISTLVTGVSANQALIDAAIEMNADAILVHHGFFWKNEDPCLVGIKYQRIKSLLASSVSLIAYHLPLDAHPVYGNNIQLGHLLGLDYREAFEVEPGLHLGYLGVLPQPLTAQAFGQLLTSKLKREPLHIPGSADSIAKVAWCTGAAQDFLNQAVNFKVDAYLTGEISERTVHIARETGVHFYAAGHHATERYGVKALGEHLSAKFGLMHHFIDIPNPV